MKLGPLEIRRAAAAEHTVSASPEKGASGTVNVGGFLVSDEYNPDLRGKNALKTYQRMLRSDGSVREAYMHAIAPALNATWVIEPASNDPLHLEQAELARRALFDWMPQATTPTEPWVQLLQLIFKFLPQGYQVLEVVDQVVEAQLQWTDPDTGEQATSQTRQFRVWKKWAHRRPETIWKWDTDSGDLVQVVQLAYKGGTWGQWEIPAANLLVFINEKEGDDFEGVSLFRSAYKAWYLKEMVEKIAAIAIERHGVGINVGYLGEEAKADSGLVNRVESMLQDLSAGERPYLVFPGPKMSTSHAAGAPQQGFLFEIVSPQGGVPDFTPFLEYLRGEIKGNVLARFSELGHGSTGARATGDTQSEPWYDAVHVLADYVSGVINPKIAEMIQANYPNVDEFPTLCARDIEVESLTEYADAISKLVISGAAVPDKSLREAVRKKADLPDEDDEDVTTPPAANPKKSNELRQVEEDPTGYDD